MRRPGNNSFEMPEFIQSHSMRVPVSLRPLTGADYDEWNEVRWRNDAWLKPWESGDPLHGAPITYKEWMKQLRRNERAGTGAVFAIEQHGRIVGQISLGAICYGAMRSGVVGYWVDERCAGRGYAPKGVRRAYMYVNDQWRDHESYVLMAEDAPNGFTARLMTGNSPS